MSKHGSTQSTSFCANSLQFSVYVDLVHRGTQFAYFSEKSFFPYPVPEAFMTKIGQEGDRERERGREKETERDRDKGLVLLGLIFMFD